MNIENVVFTSAISFQLAAALLLINNVSTSRNGIIKAYCAQHTAIAFNDDESLAGYSSLKTTIRSAWINKFAFSYLFAGYLVSIWGEVPINKCLALILVLLQVVVLIAIPIIVAKNKIEHFGVVTKNDIPKKDEVLFFDI